MSRRIGICIHRITSLHATKLKMSRNSEGTGSPLGTFQSLRGSFQGTGKRRNLLLMDGGVNRCRPGLLLGRLRPNQETRTEVGIVPSSSRQRRAAYAIPFELVVARLDGLAGLTMLALQMLPVTTNVTEVRVAIVTRVVIYQGRVREVGEGQMYRA